MCKYIGQTFIHLQTFETEQRDKDTFYQRLNPDYCKSTMYVFIRVPACLTVTVTLVYMARGVFVKTKACVEFQLINYSVNVPLLGQRHGITRQECMTSCIRSNVSCGAINFRSIDGACEFLPNQTCMSLQETVETEGTNVAQLGQCDGVPPGIGLLTPPEHRLRWLTLSQKGNRSDIDLGSGRSVARVIYKGMYLPGFTNKKVYSKQLTWNVIPLLVPTKFSIWQSRHRLTTLGWSLHRTIRSLSMPSSGATGGMGPLFMFLVRRQGDLEHWNLASIILLHKRPMYNRPVDKMLQNYKTRKYYLKTDSRCFRIWSICHLTVSSMHFLWILQNATDLCSDK